MQKGSGLAFCKEAYDAISLVYQDALVEHHAHTQRVLNRLTSTYLKPHSRVLDVGCGTGQPITKHFADKGHETTGIDYSTGMLGRARSGVPNATLLQVDMSKWEPPQPESFDLVMASHSLYNISVAQTRSMIYRMSRWVKKDGFVVIGMSYCQGTLDREGVKFDHRGWAEGFNDTFLHFQFVDTTFGKEEAWVDLIKSTGLEILYIDREKCFKANDPNFDIQFYFITKRVEENPLLGPFPIPEAFDGTLTIQPDAFNELREKMDTEKVKEATFAALLQEPRPHKVLLVTDSTTVSDTPKDLPFEFQQVSELPSSNIKPGSFDGVLIAGLQHLVAQYQTFLDQVIKAVTPTGAARIVVVAAAPDNEVVDMINVASRDLPVPQQHDGHLLKEAAKKFKAAGFSKIKYSHVPSLVRFGSSEGDEERIASAARLLSKVWTGDKAVQEQIEERLKPLLKTHFIFNSSGNIGSSTVVLVAERA